MARKNKRILINVPTEVIS